MDGVATSHDHRVGRDLMTTEFHWPYVGASEKEYWWVEAEGFFDNHAGQWDAVDVLEGEGSVFQGVADLLTQLLLPLLMFGKEEERP